ncbi:hypothetical protein Tco_1459946, partial [Tanacetum coccineum]
PSDQSLFGQCSHIIEVKWDNLRCHNQDLVFKALDKRQMREDNIISSRDKVDKLEPLDRLSKSTPSKSRMKQIPNTREQFGQLEIDKRSRWNIRSIGSPRLIGF